MRGGPQRACGDIPADARDVRSSDCSDPLWVLHADNAPQRQARPHRESTAQLSDLGEIRQSVIGAASVGDLDACRLYLGHRDVPDQERAWIYCQLSEALYHKGSRDVAVECARSAFDLQPEKKKSLICVPGYSAIAG